MTFGKVGTLKVFLLDSLKIVDTMQAQSLSRLRCHGGKGGNSMKKVKIEWDEKREVRLSTVCAMLECLEVDGELSDVLYHYRSGKIATLESLGLISAEEYDYIIKGLTGTGYRSGYYTGCKFSFDEFCTHFGYDFSN